MNQNQMDISSQTVAPSSTASVLRVFAVLALMALLSAACSTDMSDVLPDRKVSSN